MIKTKCRTCKKYFKFNGDAYGFCSKKCQKLRLKKCEPSHLNYLFKELNKISIEQEKSK